MFLARLPKNPEYEADYSPPHFVHWLRTHEDIPPLPLPSSWPDA